METSAEQISDQRGQTAMATEDLIIVSRPSDEVLEFSSILSRGSGPRPGVLVCSDGLPDYTYYLEQEARAGRISLLAVHPQPSAIGTALDQDVLRDFISRNIPASIRRVFTHSPADSNSQRSEVAYLVSTLLGHLPIFYAHGTPIHWYQFAADICHPLTGEEIERKLQALNLGYADQLRFQPRRNGPGFDTASILSVENFVQLIPADAQHLYAVRHAMDESISCVEDPWNFNNLGYEQQRLAGTAAWIREWTQPSQRIVEVGACEGLITESLVAAGYRQLTACEPNSNFRSRLTRRLAGLAVEISDCDLSALASQRAYPADCYLLTEVLYWEDNNFDILDNLPTNRLLVAVDPHYLHSTVIPWLRRRGTWRVLDERDLVLPQAAFVVAGKVFQRFGGSRGLVLAREGTV